MTLSNYSELQASIADFLNRVDGEVIAAIPSFIRLAEAQMQRELTHWKMEKRIQMLLTGRFINVPDDFREPIQLSLEGSYSSLDPVTQQHMQDLRALDDEGTPCDYAITAGQFEFYPTPANDTLDVHYIAGIPALSDTNATNWLLEEAPDAYLYGALMQSSVYLQNDERLPVWTALYTAAVQSLNTSSERAKYGGQGMRVRTPHG